MTIIDESINFRKAKLGVGLVTQTATNYNIDIEITSTLPMMTMESKLIADNVIDQAVFPSKLPADVSNILIDPSYNVNGDTKRFIYITTSASYHTFFHYSFWYDKKFKDIIVLPGLDTLITDDSILSNGMIRLSGYRLGSGKEMAVVNSEMAIGTNEKDVYQLPLTKENIANTFILADFMGLNPHHNRINSRSYTEITEQTGAVIINKGFIRDRSEPVVMVDLGKASDLFVNGAEAIPLYMVYQQSIARYSYSYLGLKKPKDYHIYVCLQF
jgi:hypothetical protein